MKRNILFSGVILAVLSFVFFSGAMQPDSPAAAQTENEQTVRTIQVSGNGEIMVQPDRARVQLGVRTEAESAQDALQLNNEQMNSVIETLLDAGVEEANIRTEVLRLNPVYENEPEGEARSLSGYQASNMVSVTIHDLDNLGQLLDAAVSAGGNSLEGIQFEISNQADAEAAAREAAMTNAQQKAEQLAALADVELGAVQTILETGFSSPVPASVVREESLAAGVPIQPGSQSVQASVQVTWEIEG